MALNQVGQHDIQSRLRQFIQWGFQTSLADPDVWDREATKHDRFEYFESLIVYVDDILVLSH